MNNLTFRKAKEDDLEAILDIYNFYILNSTATFDIGPISKEELLQRISINHEIYQTYTMNCENEMIGFCFLTQFRKKKAYDRTAEVGLYFKPQFANKGLGGKATTFLEQVAVSKQIHVLVTSICGENVASIKLAQKMGYEQCARYRQVGEKFGRLLDVVEFQKIL